MQYFMNFKFNGQHFKNKVASKGMIIILTQGFAICNKTYVAFAEFSKYKIEVIDFDHHLFLERVEAFCSGVKTSWALL